MNEHGDALPYIGFGALVPSPSCPRLLPSCPRVLLPSCPRPRALAFCPRAFHHAYTFATPSAGPRIIVPDDLYYGRSFYCGYEITRQYELSEKRQK